MGVPRWLRTLADVLLLGKWRRRSPPNDLRILATGISIKYCDENVHWRPLISTVLILVLLSISSSAAVCVVTCRTNGMQSMAMNSLSPHAGHNSAPAAHHHHEITSDSHRNVVAAASHQFLTSHTCCSGVLPTLTSSCLRSQNNTLQERTVAPTCAASGIVQHHVTCRLVSKETFRRRSIPPASVLHAFSHSLTLRI